MLRLFCRYANPLLRMHPFIYILFLYFLHNFL